MEAARQLGAAHVVQTSIIRKAIQETRALTPKDRGVDIAIEAVGVPEAWQEAVELVRKGGTVNFFGGCATNTHVTLDTNRIHYSDITLRATFHHTPAICRKALALIASGRFQASAFITGHAHLYELNRVFEKLMNRSRKRNQNRDCAVKPASSSLPLGVQMLGHGQTRGRRGLMSTGIVREGSLQPGW